MGYRYVISDINEISIGSSIWNMGNRYGIWYIDMFLYHIDMVIRDIDMGYGLMIWEMTVSIWEMIISIWDILSLCLCVVLRLGDQHDGLALGPRQKMLQRSPGGNQIKKPGLANVLKHIFSHY